MKKIMIRFNSVLFFIGLLTVFFILTNSVGCDYEFQTKKDGVRYLGICKNGHLSLVQTYIDTGDTWVIEMLQISFFKQIFWVVKKRTHTVVSEKPSYINNMNETLATDTFYNYAWLRLNDTQVVIFQSTPTKDIYLVGIDGHIDTWDYWGGYQSLFDMQKKQQ